MKQTFLLISSVTFNFTKNLILLQNFVKLMENIYKFICFRLNRLKLTNKLHCYIIVDLFLLYL